MSRLALDFLSPGNICGQTLLRLVSRGSAIIAELCRLSDHIPQVLLSGDDNPRAAAYSHVLFDFRYLKTPEMFDKQINVNASLAELDDEFFQSHEEVLARFYHLFESIYKYISDYTKFLTELSEGFYIRHTVSDVLLDPDGKQLMCEALYLWGVMLLLMDMRVPGPIRERLIIAHYRHKGEDPVLPINELAKLCRDTGFRPSEPHGKARPASYPEDYFARFAIDPSVIASIIIRLRSDDVYNLTRVYALPQLSTFALAQQASMLYVILYFSPHTLKNEKKEMREIVDKHFSDNWVIPFYMGMVVDLTVEWDRYKAAKEALAMDTLKPDHVRKLVDHHIQTLVKVDAALSKNLKAGVLTETYVVDELKTIMDDLRLANTSLRWVMLHRRTDHKAFRTLILDPKAFQNQEIILDFLLRTALLELRIHSHIKHLLAIKPTKWATEKENTAALMMELTDYFSGSRALTRVERNEDMMNWFNELATEIRALDYTDVTLAGRKIKKLISALKQVQQFDVIDASPNIKEFLFGAMKSLEEMVHTVNVTDMVMSDLQIIGDLTHAWEIIRDYAPVMHERIKRDPHSVSTFRALFMKLASVVDTPLNRVVQADSKDQQSVAEYYSEEVVGFLRKVMEVIPVIVFQTLAGIIKLQTRDMKPVPIKFEALYLRDFSQLDARFELASRTHQISVFTEGTLAMKKTLLGVIKVDPRDILHDGIRKHLVDQISTALHNTLVFDTRIGRGKDPVKNMTEQLRVLRDILSGFRKSFEYVQDYIGIYGLRMWQEEFTRIMAFNTEQECNKYLKRRILEDASKYQSTSIPIPLILRAPAGDTSGAMTFMGRLVDALQNLTDPKRTLYGPGCLGGIWYEPASGNEIAGLSFFSLLNEAVGVPGLVGADRLLGFAIEKELSKLSKAYSAEIRNGLDDVLLRMVEDVQPTTSLSNNIIKHYTGVVKKANKLLDVMAEWTLSIGHAQLLRRAIAHELRFSCRLDSNLLCGALEALNAALLNDMRKHYYNAEAHPMPGSDSELLPALAKFAEASGMYDPLTNIYVTAEPQPCLGFWLSILAVSQIGKFTYDKEVGCLVRRKAEPVDGAPLVAGLVTVMRQAHPSVLIDFIEYTAQYVRASIIAGVGKSKDKGATPEIGLLVLLLQHVARVAGIPDRVMHAHLPRYVYETVFPV